MSAYKRHKEDPHGAERPRGKSRERRKAGRDPGLTPTERYIKGQLMNQFRRTGEGPGGNSELYKKNYDATFGKRSKEPKPEQVNDVLKELFRLATTPQGDPVRNYAAGYDGIDWSK